MQYIVHRRFKGNAICGEVNLPTFSVCECEDGIIKYSGNPICYIASENSHQYFARNDDGNGVLRGKLTQSIQKNLAKRDDNYQIRWDKVWDDDICKKYKRIEYADYWLWNHAFFEADIDDLQHIADLVGAKVKEN